MYSPIHKKDLDYKMLSLIEEQLNQELLLYKKYLAFGSMFIDSELKGVCHQASKKHKENYQSILSYLESSVSSTL